MKNGTSSSHYDWISFETENKLIPNSTAYIYKNNESESDNEGNDMIVNTEQILMFGTLIQENFKPWKNYSFPELILIQQK